jgi:dolichyl-phosphate beta-glucosyltransferase
LTIIGDPTSGDSPPRQSRCTVVIPCYNEADRLRLDAFGAFLSSPRSRNVELLFVNDGSRDATLSVLQTLRSLFPEKVKLLDKQPNAGKAEAVRHGMLHAIYSGEAELTGFWDADLATPLDQIPDLAGMMAERPELSMVFGARVRLLGRAIQRQPLRHYLGRCFATVASLALRLPIYDTQCGAKLFRITPELKDALAEPFQSRWIFDVELLARFVAMDQSRPDRLKEHIYEYPLPEWTDVAGSKVASGDFFKAFGELAGIYRRYLA